MTDDVRSARRALMAAMAQATRGRMRAADIEYAVRTSARPFSPAEFEAELQRREAEWAAEDAARAGQTDDS